MLWSKSFIPTLKEIPQGAEAISHQLLLRAGLIRMLTSGVYIYLPLGLSVLKNIEKIIREELDAIGAQELLLSCLQPIELWQKTGRDKVLEQTLISFTDRRGRKLCLGPTHEEVITNLVKNHISSYRQLPLVLYQIQTKFRDEVRPRFGLMRACEFVMKDAYSFDRDKDGLDKNYKLMLDAYQRIFKRCGIDTLVTEADPGMMGGGLSHEFMVLAKNGEDQIYRCKKCSYVATATTQELDKKIDCPNCKNIEMIREQAIEVGHIFQLGTKYSLQLEARFLDEDGKQKPIIMGCYGIGVSRVISAIVETNFDSDGIIWPKNISPFDILILPLQLENNEVKKLSLQYYKELSQDNLNVLLDERQESAGVKFKDADLIGVPLRITIGEENLRKGLVEIKVRRTGQVLKVDKNSILEKTKSLREEIT